MESDAENKRKGLLALGLLGFLLIVVLAVFTLFDDEDGAEPGASATASPTASGGAAAEGTGGASAGGDGPAPIMSRADIAAAHDVMARYMAGIATYSHTSAPGTWVPPLLELTNRDTAMKQETALPRGKEWATCKAAKCVSKGTAVVKRDAMIADDLTRGSGQSISSVVEVTARRTFDGDTSEETNAWLVTVQKSGGQWRVSGFDIFGLGNVGASDQTGE
ncbi:hypothetical protein [Streptomyces sp. NPDC053542]|uniref:hypothetical protein n=1 Tax=Streptomyces sp. NPDC053542 TaxID=3365710 RepID=UPI0037D83018